MVVEGMLGSIRSLIALFRVHRWRHARDFSNVRTWGRAEELFACGRLDRIFLWPPELGGKDLPSNICFVPRKAARLKTLVDGTVMAHMREGRICRYTALPEYKGGSFIPARIVIKAWKSDKQASTSIIEIW
ncbi:hypothetical protein CA260_10415 [Dyella jiangningensis]|uniref:Uncharacterized protein n=1 Tax=Dyella jiangningensis TaxID=1379159 RepID=A0A328P7D8_9GAMM|nr:hypothetical protein CA260_10415 [Dyella jiangningensis]